MTARANNGRSPNGRTTPKKTKVGLDLDKLEREGEQPEPFTFRHGDKVFTLADPAEIDFRDIVELGTAGALGNAVMLSRLLGDQYEEMTAAGPLPQWKCGPLLNAWFEHYDIDPGEAGASSTSLSGTARR